MTTTPQEADRLTFTVDPARLAHGAWCHRAEKTLGQGDISASYSADRIGMDQPVRKAFSWQGASWLCVGSGSRNGANYAEAYRLVHPSQFPGVPTSYREKLRDSDRAPTRMASITDAGPPRRRIPRVVRPARNLRARPNSADGLVSGRLSRGKLLPGP